MGMALEESVENMNALEANSVTAYIDTNLQDAIARHGDINIDYVERQTGGGGFQVAIGHPAC